jgi:hypothetical protein
MNSGYFFIKRVNKANYALRRSKEFNDLTNLGLEYLLKFNSTDKLLYLNKQSN